MTELNYTNKAHNRNFIESSFIGLVEYNKSLEIQNRLLNLSFNQKGHYVIGLEHPAVVTLGYRAKLDEEIYDSRLPIERTNRGGLATIHSEGQLIIYPVLNLREMNLGVRKYVLLLLETTQELLQSLNIDSSIDDKCIGLYTKIGKIAFCGVQVKNGVSQHGLSLNVRNDLSLFSNIRSCGQNNANFDSLINYNTEHTISELYHSWVEIFKTKLE